MSDPIRRAVHTHRLATSTKLLLAAVALGLIANALAPFLQVRETRAQGMLGVMSMTCEGVLPQPGKTLKLNCTGTAL